MAATKSADRETARPSEQDLLESFLRAVENFVEQIGVEATKAAPEGAARLMIASTAESVVAQAAKLTGYVRQNGARLSAPQRQELNRLLQVQDVEGQTNRAIGVATQLFGLGLNSTTLLHWLSQHLKEIKKIIDAIIDLLGELLGFDVPPWIETIKVILDEIFDLLLSLLSEVFGFDFRVTARQLSEQEVSFLRELAALEALKAARAGGRKAKPEES